MVDKTLYKLNKRGKLQMWRIYTSGNQFFTEDWIQDGKVKQGKPTTAKPKNVGRANATTADEQAEAEAKAKITKKLNQGGYTEDAANASMYAQYFEPMLANVGRKFDLPCFISTKLDGIRMIYKNGKVTTRKGKSIFTVAHIIKELDAVVPKEWILDGEIYSHEYRDEFEELVSIIKREKPTESDLKTAEEKLEYHVYDILTSEEDSSSNAARFSVLEKLFSGNPNFKYIKLVKCEVVKNEEELENKHTEYLDTGYEGSMLRRMLGPYKRAGRSNDLIKKKDFFDEEFEIIGIEEGKGNRAGEAGKIVCIDKFGKEFRPGIKGDQKLRLDMLNNPEKYIGKMATVQHFGLTSKGSYRFPTFQRMWEDI